MNPTYIWSVVSRSFTRFDKRVVRTVAALAGFFVLLIVAFAVFGVEEPASENPEEALRTVETIAVSEYRSGAVGLSVPTADGRSFVVRAESGGRINRVLTRSGAVAQGAILVELDNSAQRAALTQARGIYEAAQAGAARSDIGVNDAEEALRSAKTALTNAVRSSLTAWTDVLYNTLDQLYDKPLTKFPTVLIDAPGEVPFLSRERGELNTVLTEWQNRNTQLDPEQSVTTLSTAADAAIRDTDRLVSLVGRYLLLLPQQKFEDRISEADRARLQSAFATAQGALIAQKNSLQGSRSALIRAEENLKSASIGGTGGDVSLADAQITQALGSYQAAQAAFDKTIVRAPFAGTVSSLNVQVGDFINPGSDIAIIVPNAGVETDSVFTLPLSAVKYTPDNAYVLVADAAGTLQAISVKTGLVTASSIQVKGLTGDEVIVRDVRGLKAGDKVHTK